MCLFTISDLHLDTVTGKKSMEVFGNRWKGYIDKIHDNWSRIVGDRDVVVIPGDISWSLNQENALSDFKWIDALPGKKVLMKGNHDFWWSTVTKMQDFFKQNDITTIHLMQNNAYELDKYNIAGSRGWFVDPSTQPSKSVTANYEKMINREVIRLRMSLDEAAALREANGKEILVFLHFPPIWNSFECLEILSLLEEYDIRRCYFGHIHGCYTAESIIIWKNIEFRLVSADYINFIPYFIG